MEPIDLGGHVGQEQLQLGKEGEVVGGDVGMWAAADIVLYEPVWVQWAQDTQHVQVRLGVENSKCMYVYIYQFIGMSTHSLCVYLCAWQEVC